MAQLLVTADADADTQDILSYLERVAGARTAAEYGRRFELTLRRIVDLPETGPPRPRLGANTRIGVVPPYILIYDYVPDEDTVVLLRILHGRRRITVELLGR